MDLDWEESCTDCNSSNDIQVSWRDVKGKPTSTHGESSTNPNFDSNKTSDSSWNLGPVQRTHKLNLGENFSTFKKDSGSTYYDNSEFTEDVEGRVHHLVVIFVQYTIPSQTKILQGWVSDVRRMYLCMYVCL